MLEARRGVARAAVRAGERRERAAQRGVVVDRAPELLEAAIGKPTALGGREDERQRQRDAEVDDGVSRHVLHRDLDLCTPPFVRTKHCMPL